MLCYQAACVAAGLPDPFPACDDCGEIIWQLNTAGEIDMVVRGQKCRHDPETGQNEWVAGRWHPECAPPEAPLDPYDEACVETPPAPAVEPAPTPDEPTASPTQATLDGKPVCPRCQKPIHRSPFPFDGRVYHKQCGARERVKANPSHARRVSSRKLPKCVVCGKAVRDDKYRVVCDTDTGEEFYHRKCYRQACIAGGLDDPYPEDKEQLVAQLAEGRERKKRERAEATVLCGICDQKVLRTAYVDHVGPCAARARETNAEAAGE